MKFLSVALIVLYTGIFGSLAIIACLFVPGGSAFALIARIWATAILRTCGIESTANRHPAIATARPCIYMANHQSQLDIPVLIVAMPSTFRFVAKRELLYIPIFGWALWLAGFIFVDRGDRSRAIRSLQRSVERARSGGAIIIFPEGTRSPDGHMLPFKKGGFILALQAGVPIIPVSIRGGHAVLPKGSLRIRPGRMDVVFGQPIETIQYTFESRDRLIEAVRRAIENGLAYRDSGSGA